jgi:hypothetical protein
MVAINKDFNQQADTPPEHILEWCRQAVRIIADGGVWGIPRSGTIFRVDHKNKQLVLIMPGNDDEADYNATKHVFKFIGWTVVKDK